MRASSALALFPLAALVLTAAGVARSQDAVKEKPAHDPSLGTRLPGIDLSRAEAGDWACYRVKNVYVQDAKTPAESAEGDVTLTVGSAGGGAVHLAGGPDRWFE